MLAVVRRAALSLCILAVGASTAVAQAANPLFKDAKVKNYIPHMTWTEVEEALKHTDMVVIPVGSNEQHGPALPLGSDSLAAVEACKLLAQRTDVLIAPVVLAGLSEHHMGFPGTITLSPETFEAVLVDTARSLVRHGFRKLMFYNGHGGNTVSVRNAIQRINQTTPAAAVLLNDLKVPPAGPKNDEPAIDWHAGVEESSLMLYLTPTLVDMSRAVKPTLTLPGIAQKVEVGLKAEPNLALIVEPNLFRPIETGKKASSREMSATGIFTSGDPRAATAEQGRDEVEAFLQTAVKFIEAWRAVTR